MKTTIDLPDGLIDEACKLAQRERTTLEALIEQGLREVLADRKHRAGFRLRAATFKGNGLDPRSAGASWEAIRDASYESRGG